MRKTATTNTTTSTSSRVESLSSSSSSSSSLLDSTSIHGSGIVFDERMTAAVDGKQENDTNFVTRFLSQMSLDDCIGQMSQIDINMLLDDDKMTLNTDVATKFIGELGIGSVLNVPSAKQPWTARQFREVAIALNQIATKYGHPPIIWGLDSVHGANYVANTVVCSQPINLAATFNRTSSYWSGQVASRDTRAAGIHWLFSPLLGIAINPKWSRVYETFGEDPLLVATMASAMITGIQEPADDDDNVYPNRAAACAKHFIGYSHPHTGHDRSPSWIPTRHLYQYFVPPWKAVLGSIKTEQKQYYDKAMTVMESYTEIDGVPMVANKELLNYLLRYRFHFDGVLVTDYSEIYNLYDWHHTVGTKLDAVLTSISEGSVDISMIPWEAETYITSIKEGISTHSIQEERIRQSTQRIIQLKYDLGMFNNTLTIVDTDLNIIGAQADRQEALNIAQDSIILVKNNDNSVLPIQDTSVKIHVTGPTSNSLIYQSGGWTGQWQGMSNETTWASYGTRVLESMKESFDSVTYTCGVDILGNDCTSVDETKRNWDDNVIDSVKHWAGLIPSNSIARTVEMSKDSDYIIVCLGEEAYAEKPGDIRSLKLPQGQYDLVHAIAQNIPDTTKIVLVYFGGRSRLLTEIVSKVDAILIAFLPGPDGGQAISNIVDGTINPNGRLPITYPAFDDNGGVPYFHSISDQCTTADDTDPYEFNVRPLPHYQYIQCPIQWSFGYGLSYTTFEYTNFNAQGGIDEDLHVSVVVTNTGTVVGKETVMFFTFDEYRTGVTPEYKRLRGYQKISLKPGETKTVRKVINEQDFRYVGPHDDRHTIIDPTMKAWVGVGAMTDCRVNNGKDNALCVELSSHNPNRQYSAACDAACTLWIETGCHKVYDGMADTKACQDLCVSVGSSSDSSSSLNDGWGWNYVNCLESVVWGMQQRQTSAKATESLDSNDCWMMTSLCRDIFTSGIRNEYGRLFEPKGTQLPSTIIANSIMDGGCTNPLSAIQHKASSSSNIISFLLPMILGCVSTLLSLYLWNRFKNSNHYSDRRVGKISRPTVDDERFSGIQFTEVRMIS